LKEEQKRFGDPFGCSPIPGAFLAQFHFPVDELSEMNDGSGLVTVYVERSRLHTPAFEGKDRETDRFRI
jgi:hypothetical protein